MPDVIFSGPQGRLEGRYHPAEDPRAPVALILHPCPAQGGSMNNRVTYAMYCAFQKLGFSVLRYNSSGVGKSQGSYQGQAEEVADAASALDWLQSQNPLSNDLWVAGYSSGAYIAMQLLMRRPEIRGWISIAPPTNQLDFGFLAPCPCNGLVIAGDRDKHVPENHVRKLVDKLNAQKSIEIDYHVVKDADHLFSDKSDEIIDYIVSHVENRFGPGSVPLIGTTKRKDGRKRQ